MAQLNAGNGADGNATDSTGTNLSIDSLVGRSHADMIAFNCSSVGSNSAILSTTPSGIVVGDEILLMCMAGTQSNYDNVGNYETFRISDISSNTITFTESKTKYYGNNGGDTNIGTSEGTLRVVLQRVPNYADFTIDNGQTTVCDEWDGTKGGVFFVKANGTATVNGSISLYAKGYRAGTLHFGVYGQAGESITGKSTASSQSRNLGGGGGDNFPQNSAAGGGYGTVGQDGVDYSGQAQGGTTYGVNTLLDVYLGSAGGRSSSWISGDGGGMIILMATTLHMYGSLACNGMNGNHGNSGSGSGGSILIHAGTIYSHSSSVQSVGGTGGYDGGKGRIAIYYNALGDTLVTSNPVAYTDDTLELPYFVSGVTNKDMTIYVMDSSMVKLAQDTVSAGDYEISNLPSSGPFHVIGIPTVSGSNLLGYRDIVPNQ